MTQMALRMASSPPPKAKLISRVVVDKFGIAFPCHFIHLIELCHLKKTIEGLYRRFSPVCNAPKAI